MRKTPLARFLVALAVSPLVTTMIAAPLTTAYFGHFPRWKDFTEAMAVVFIFGLLIACCVELFLFLPAYALARRFAPAAWWTAAAAGAGCGALAEPVYLFGDALWEGRLLTAPWSALTRDPAFAAIAIGLTLSGAFGGALFEFLTRERQPAQPALAPRPDSGLSGSKA